MSPMGEYRFSLYKMMDLAPITSTFSKLPLQLSKIVHANHTPVLQYKNLCNFEKDCFEPTSDGIAKLLTFNTRKEWHIGEESLEKVTFYYVLKHLILPLSKTVVVLL